jgi:hypothetical protein
VLLLSHNVHDSPYVSRIVRASIHDSSESQLSESTTHVVECVIEL